MASLAERPRLRQWLAVAGLAAVLAGHGTLADWQRNHAFMVNASESLPNWAFFVAADKAPGRGEYVFFSPPKGPLLLAHFGEDGGPFGKQVLGVPGDVVAHQGSIVSVNGHAVARMKSRTRTGEALTPGPVGTVPRDCYYVGTAHADGFDSRYAEIGFVCRRQILGTGTPIL